MKRLSREAFWKLFTIPFIATYSLIVYLHLYDYEIIEKWGENIYNFGIVLCIFGVIYCSIIFTRRIKDFDFSGWYTFTFITVFIFSLDYKPLGLYLLLFLFIVIILLHVKKGNPGTNRFGKDPYNVNSLFIENTLAKKIENIFTFSKNSTNTILNNKLDNFKSFIHNTDLKKNLIGNEWTVLNAPNKTTLIFHNNGQVLNIINGEVIKNTYEITENNNSLIINDTVSNKSSIYKINFLENEILVLNKYGTDEIIKFKGKKIIS